MAAGRASIDLRALALATAAAGLLLGAPAFELQAQTVSGHLLESQSTTRIVRGEVSLLDLEGGVVATAFTDLFGAFVLTAPGPGDYLLKAERSGYRTKVDGILELGEEGKIEVEFYLRPQPISLESLIVTSERSVLAHLKGVGFYDRMEIGHGHFITPAEIRARKAPSVANLLRSVPGVTIQESGPLPSIALAGGKNGRCEPTVWVDGTARYSALRAIPGLVIDELVSVRDIEAMEIYRGAATVPVEFNVTLDGCGAILVWTIQTGFDSGGIP